MTITYSQAKALRMLTEGTSIPASLDVSVVQTGLIEAGLVRPTGYQITPAGCEALAGYDAGVVEHAVRDMTRDMNGEFEG